MDTVDLATLASDPGIWASIRQSPQALATLIGVVITGLFGFGGVIVALVINA